MAIDGARVIAGLAVTSARASVSVAVMRLRGGATASAIGSVDSNTRIGVCGAAVASTAFESGGTDAVNVGGEDTAGFATTLGAVNIRSKK